MFLFFSPRLNVLPPVYSEIVEEEDEEDEEAMLMDLPISKPLEVEDRIRVTEVKEVVEEAAEVVEVRIPQMLEVNKTDHQILDTVNEVSPELHYSSDPFDNDFHNIIPPLNSSDKSHYEHLNLMQMQLKSMHYEPSDTIHSQSAISFYQNILHAPPLVIDTLREGYLPTFQSSIPITYHEQNNLSARKNMPFVR